MGPRRRLRALALALAVSPGLVAPSTAAANPADAASGRKPVQEKARDMRVAGDHATAASYLAEEAARLKDPVLFLDAAEAYKAAAEASRDATQVEQGAEQARIASDMLHFLGDDRAGNAWEPVTDDHRESLLARTDTLLAECEELAAEIAAGPVEAAPPPEPEARRPRKPGQGLIIGGAVAAGVGVGGLGLAAAGIGMGSLAQKTVEDPTVYGAEYDDWDAYGKQGNTLAWVGGVIGAVGLGAGVALIVLGLKKRRQGNTGSDSARLHVAPTPGGLWAGGSF